MKHSELIAETMARPGLHREIMIGLKELNQDILMVAKSLRAVDETLTRIEEHVCKLPRP